MGGYLGERLASGCFLVECRGDASLCAAGRCGGDWGGFGWGVRGRCGLEEGAAQDWVASQVPDADLEVVACLEQTAGGFQVGVVLPGAGVR